MKSVLIALVAISVVGLVAGNVLAAGAATSQPACGVKGHHHFLAHLAKELNLTDAQKTQIEPIIKNAHEQAQATQDKQEKRKIWKNAMEQVKALLTPDQLAKLKTLREEHKGAHAGASQPSGV